MTMPQTVPWWKRAVIYQVYPRSFLDSNGDGVGDLQGVISKLDYLKSLGVDALWLSPVYLSPNKDFGYDVADYQAINPEFGTLDDMKQLINEAKIRGIRLIIDLVVNHTSDQHEWFQKARDPTSPYRDYYIWRKGKVSLTGREKPPNNWTSFFTGPAWEKDAASDEYYLHLFTKHQPDLNYDNPAVFEEVKKIINFWLDLGVSGFRCDVINIIHKDSLEDGLKRPAAGGQEYYTSTPATHAILKRLHDEIFAPRNAFTVGEAAFVTLDQAIDFTEGDELDTVFSFDHVEHDLTPRLRVNHLLQELVRWQRKLPWNTIFLENHDQPRSVSTYGDENKHPTESAKALAMLLLTLRGTPFIYQGQEIGMVNTPLDDISQAKDPVTHTTYRRARRALFPKRKALKIAMAVGRDAARTPVQWSSAIHAGFSSGTPWMPVHPNYAHTNVELQERDPGSVLSFYKALIALRKKHPVLTNGNISFSSVHKHLIVYTRTLGIETATVIVSLSIRRRPVPKNMTPDDKLLLATHHEELRSDTILQPYEARVYLTKGQ
ncbi:alpha-glucosidase [Candidatus Saccharibacteria bacterium]|nr:alpha-glucosidase [Candidatus Saccharibacteria bacterium]